MKKTSFICTLCCLALITAFSACGKKDTANGNATEDCLPVLTETADSVNNSEADSEIGFEGFCEVSGVDGESRAVETELTTYHFLKDAADKNVHQQKSVISERISNEYTEAPCTESELSAASSDSVTVDNFEGFSEYSEKNVFRVFDGIEDSEGLIKVDVSLVGNVSICGADAELRYPKALELVSVDGDFDADTVVNPDRVTDTVYFNFSFTKNKNKPLKILELAFRVRSDSLKTVPIELYVKSAKEITGNRIADAEYSVVNGVVKINE